MLPAAVIVLIALAIVVAVSWRSTGREIEAILGQSAPQPWRLEQEMTDEDCDTLLAYIREG